jgi:hypothetical protein
MTRADTYKRPQKVRASNPRPRTRVSSAAPASPNSDGLDPSPDANASHAQASTPAAAIDSPGIRDALALCGLVLHTFGPDVVLAFLGRIAVYGADLLLTICESARRAAEIAHQAHVHVGRAARTQRRRRRTSRTTSRP